MSSTQNTAMLSITDGVDTKIYTLADLQAHEQRSMNDKVEAYVGVSLSVLLSKAGFNTKAVTEVQGVSSDNFIVNYSPGLILQPDMNLVYSYSKVLLTADNLLVCMVASGLGGKFIPRLVVEPRVTLL